MPSQIPSAIYTYDSLNLGNQLIYPMTFYGNWLRGMFHENEIVQFRNNGIW